jgi:hypothetical protein
MFFRLPRRAPIALVRAAAVFHFVKRSLTRIRCSLRAASRSTPRLILLALAALVAEACSLTVGDFEPEQVTSENQPEPPGDELGSACPEGQRCCSTDSECSASEGCIDGTCQTLACGIDANEASSCGPCVGSDCLAPEELAPSCSDGVQNGDETGSDCGGSCPEPCAGGEAGCTGPADCASRVCVGGACAEPSCTDDTQNQDETGIDCGGSCEQRCAAGQGCSSGDDCTAGLFCSADGLCTDPSCQDELQNGDESDTDCGGGTCPGCADGSACAADSDCQSGVCGPNALCATPSCNDDTRNQDETGVDCGGVCPAGCGNGGACVVAADCVSNVCGTAGCANGVARCCQAPSCNDELQNGFESDTDCGGNCADCPNLSSCRVDGDCVSNDCEDGVCVACNDNQENGSETDLDCGGPNACPRCAPGLECTVDGDCASNACEDGRCCGGNQVDCTRCAARLSQNLSCSLGPPGAEPFCSAFLQCLSDNADVCPTRFAAGCSGEGNVCNHNFFGGDGGIALTFVTQILNEAGCAQ